jgi:glycopeptide antibiotics resistance protein
MVIEFYPYPLLISLLTLAIVLVILWRRKHSPVYLFCFSLFVIYLSVALCVVFFPIRLPQDWLTDVTVQTALWTLSHINLNPFNNGDLFSMNASIIFWNLGGNILLTLPFGLGLPLLVPVSIRRILWVALFAGLFFETTQLVIELSGLVSGYGHSIDINDVVLNAAGILIGYSLLRMFAGCVKYKPMFPAIKSVNMNR